MVERGDKRLIFLVLIVSALFAHETFFNFTSDDAFVYFRYAGNSIRGRFYANFALRKGDIRFNAWKRIGD